MPNQNAIPRTATLSSFVSSFCLTPIVWLAAIAAAADERLPAAPASEAVQLKTVVAEALQPKANLLSNPGFKEIGPNGIPNGWQWDRRNTDATCSVDRTIVHCGRHPIAITNGTGYGPHVFGMLWHSRPVKLAAGKPYTMSAWVKSDSPGIVSLVGGSDWRFRVQVRPTAGQWRHIWKTFTPRRRDCDFVLRINTESPTPGVWIDDVKLEEGTAPTVDLVDGGENAPASLDVEESEVAVQGDGPFGLKLLATCPRPVAGTFEAALSSGESLRQPIHLAAGSWRVLVGGEATSAHDAPRTVTLRLEDAGKTVAQAQMQVEFCSASNALSRLGVLRATLPSLERDLEAVKTRGQDISYPEVTFTVLENFVGYAEKDARDGEVKSSLEQVGDMERMAARLSRELKEALAGRRQFAAVPRWTGTKRPIVKSSSFVAPVRLAGGATAERPVFFTGFGHFGQVVADMEKWPHYGANIIQIEFGPNSVFPAEGQTSDAPMRKMLQTLDRAQKAGVAVCLLISPHYFPHWALAKWPHLRKQREGFLQYCLHAPEGRELLRRFIATAIAPLKDHPALQSICLSNEPVNEEEPCEFAKQQWQAWLEKRHGNVASLNASYGSKFASLAEVPLPNPFGPRPAQAVVDGLHPLQPGVLRGLAQNAGRRGTRGGARPAGPCQGHDLDDAWQWRRQVWGRCRSVRPVQQHQRKRLGQPLPIWRRRVRPGMADSTPCRTTCSGRSSTRRCSTRRTM